MMRRPRLLLNTNLSVSHIAPRGEFEMLGAEATQVVRLISGTISTLQTTAEVCSIPRPFMK
jgi:hypothetical protein